MSESNGKVDSFVFEDITPQSIPVTLGKGKYVLIEATEDAAVKYRNACTRALKVDGAGKIVGAGDIAEVQPLLVSLCLCHTNPDGSIKMRKIGQEEVPDTVSLSFVKTKLTSRIVKKLFTWVKDHSDLVEKTEDDTIESIQKRMIEDRAKLDKLLVEKGEKPDPTNLSLNSGEDTSPSASDSDKVSTSY